jgi:hypothetical protein
LVVRLARLLALLAGANAGATLTTSLAKATDVHAAKLVELDSLFVRFSLPALLALALRAQDVWSARAKEAAEEPCDDVTAR